MDIVHCKLPAAGLGNQLFPLMKACVFANINELPLIVTNYHQVKIGPYLRREKSKRNYNHYFKFQRSVLQESFQKLRIDLKGKTHEVIKDPLLTVVRKTGNRNTLYRFGSVPHWSNYFEGLKEHRQLAISLLGQLVTPEVLHQADGQESPEIGVHIRMGDFRKLLSGEDFSKLGTVRTPSDYFIEVIGQLRAVCGSKTRVSVFSDGHKKELDKVLQLPNTHLVEGNSDLADMLLLSRSKIIVTSAGSTFGYWSGFLSDAPVIMHPDHIHESIRNRKETPDLYEGPLDSSAISFLKGIYQPSV
jgi:Glycosyl transferase family 11